MSINPHIAQTHRFGYTQSVEFIKQDSGGLSFTWAHWYPPPAGASQNETAMAYIHLFFD